jgi:hypothetical protein
LKDDFILNILQKESTQNELWFENGRHGKLVQFPDLPLFRYFLENRENQFYY